MKVATTEIQILDEIAEITHLNREQVAAVLDGLAVSIKERVKEERRFTFSLPGLMEIQTLVREEVPARRGINPFTKEEVTFSARPATIVAKIRLVSLRRKPKQTLKDMVFKKPKGK